MKHIPFYILALLSLLQSVYGQQTNSKNYIISRTYKQAGANANQIDKVTTQVQYMDGLGRSLQTVGVKQSPLGSDIVQSVEYDALGRQAKQYLPYVAAGNGAFQDAPSTAVPTWYTANSALLQGDDLSNPFSESFFEPTPLGRLTGQRAPGGKSAPSALEYKVNTAADDIKRYDFSGSLTPNGSYGAGQLTVTKTTDEQGKVVLQYTDMLGKIICKQVVVSGTETLSTYYVYDDNGWLRVVLQPKYQDDANLTNYAFQYDYDSRGRIIIKKIPGSGTTEIVYDKFDRPAMSRDANQAARGVWGFTKFDALNRPVVTGEIPSTSDRATLAGSVDTGAEHHEIRNNAATEGYTLNKTAPTSATLDHLRTIIFYDDYSFSKGANLNYNAASAYGGDLLLLPKSYSTGARTRVLLSNGSMGDWLTSAIYYDTEYRPIQSIRELYDLGSTAVERISTKYLYDLASVVAEQKTEQILSATVTNTHLATFTYDHADRLLSVKEKVTNGLNATSKEAFTIAQRYNTLGQLQSKWFHSVNETKYRHRTDYTYNIRGWVTDGKTVYKTLASSPDKSIFAFGMEYKKGDGNYTNKNISKAQWRGKDEDQFTAGLNFAYDGADRLSGSTGISYAGVTYPNTESGISYDKNGNITNLTRSGASVDNLTYSYSGTGNKLFSISDGSGINSGVKSGTYGYSYDANGNMLTDNNRGAVIAYNYLNLPRTVVIGGKTLAYDYDASGGKHKYAGGSMTLKYAGSFEYKRVGSVDSLYRVSLNDAQAVYRNGGLKFEYYVKDHLENARVVFDETGAIIQKSDYYAFGLAINKDLPVTTEAARNATNRYLYNGKELQDGSGYVDYGARMYMPEIGRWGSGDPLSEKWSNVSPYSFTLNNPLNLIDPNGMDVTDMADRVRFTGEDKEAILFALSGENDDNGCPPNCPQTSMKTDATSRARTITQQIASGSIPLISTGQSILYNTDTKWSRTAQWGNKNDQLLQQLSTTNGFSGVGAGLLENYSGATRIGRTGIYTLGSKGGLFYGNQFARTYGLAGIGKMLGNAGLIFGGILDFQGVQIYKTEGPNASGAVHPGKATLNTAVGIWGVTVGSAVGFTGGAVYFGIDTFYPGGWNGAMNNNYNLLKQNQKVLGPSFNLYKD
ncbi:DUF6443 domain-containing protein [Dyadobacter frigoris]|uniref:RHS repeat-associated core domain-containing protein n=1 Tax=Dyadobacter frigoris TaxID=2576211 RepID=A0A4U6D3W0_9BACT|nr:DUF6443 domain-containing protein [Dyadobacter frigoris]TKT88614.1 RHS repeat-associated core domain-containing protein [Dyadobacter frigoris]GLU54948.1 cell wall-associated protein [Dyadobacter frigoris]